VAGIGNLFQSDDGFGPEVARLLAERGHVPEQVRIVDYGIRGMHLAYDLLTGYDALVIADAVPYGQEPGDITIMKVGAEDLGRGEFDAHGMNPVAVLGSQDLLGGTLPATYVVGCRPDSLEDGIGLSDRVAAVLPEAITQVEALLAHLCADPAPEPTDTARH
jgi:hydrogenase maturation protease